MDYKEQSVVVVVLGFKNVYKEQSVVLAVLGLKRERVCYMEQSIIVVVLLGLKLESGWGTRNSQLLLCLVLSEYVYKL